MAPFARFELRTTDVAAARAFYGALLAGGCPDVSPLPAQAVARGARPHWLGHVGVDDPAATRAQLLAQGSVALGPTALRLPGGELLAIASPAKTRADVAWHQLLTTDAARAQALYAEVFGWNVAAARELDGLPLWHFTRGPLGALASLDGRPGVHPQWLYFFGVDDLALACEQVRAAGGRVLTPTTTPNGAQVVVCDDPQGGAFGLSA